MDDILTVLKQIRENHNTAVDQNVNDNVLIIDGMNTFVRVFSVVPTMNDDGMHIGGITGFLQSIALSIRQFNPTRCVVVFDGKGGSERRKKIYPEYKERRKTTYRLNRKYEFKDDEQEHDAMLRQLVRSAEYIDSLPVTIMVIDNVEADDVIAYVAELLRERKSKKTVLLSTDKDFLQLVDENTFVWNPARKILYNRKEIKKQFIVSAENFLLYRLIDGDPSDNINGVRGIGPKTIIKKLPLLLEDKKVSVDGLLEFASKKLLEAEDKIYSKLIESKDILYRNEKLMQLSHVTISGTTKSQIRELFDAPINMLNKFKFKQMFMHDKLWVAFPNVESWLLTNFNTLNAYAIKTRNNK